jgi:SAM-dependent methyltransferase
VWPKRVPPLSPEQREIQEDWIKFWLEEVSARHGWFERFNKGYADRSRMNGCRTLEVGPGRGGYLRFEDLATQDYYAIELREDLAAVIRRDFPSVTTIVGDCQDRLPFDDGFFDRVVMLHVLEHLPDLPSALDEVRRVLKLDGRLSVVIPCEGGLLYSIGRRFTSKRAFERRYGVAYEWHIRSDHLNRPEEILAEIRHRFRILDRTFFPCRVPVVHLNLMIGITATAVPDTA